MKRLRQRGFIAILLIGTLLLISACGGSDPTPAPAPTEAPPPTEAPAEPTEVPAEEPAAEPTEVPAEEPAASEELTGTEEITATEEVTASEDVTATEELTATEEVTTSETVSDTAAAAPEGEVIAEGLNGPMGVFVGEDGSVWVIDSGMGGEEGIPFISVEGQPITATFGMSARVVQVNPDGEQSDVVSLPSIGTPSDMIGGARIVVIDDVVYVTVGQWLGDPSSEPSVDVLSGVAQIVDGEATQLASTWEIEAAENPGSFVYDTHPYGLAVDTDGTLLVADAGANDLLRVDPATGEVSLVAVFEGQPGPFPNPGRGDAMETDPVPTGVVVDDEGTIYVAFLPGFPFAPGSAKVVTVTAEGEVSDYATGLTMITDIELGPDGNLYGVQFAIFGEQGPQPSSGALVLISEGEESTPVLEGLSFPTSVDFDADGNAYVTINGVGAPESGQVVKFAGVAAE